MIVLVTGATGFIGNHVVECLLSQGVSVKATSRQIEKAKNFEWFPKVEYCEYTIGEIMTDEHVQFFRDCTHCIHLAWDGLPDFKHPDHVQKHPTDHINFINHLHTLGVRHFTITGTCLEYGLTEGELTEDLYCTPVTSYGQGKLTLLEQLHSVLPDNSWSWLRLFYMFGKGQHPKSILPQLQTTIDNNESVFNMSGGEQSRDYLPIEKIAKIIVSLNSKNQGFGVINLCSGKPIKIAQLIDRYLIQQKVTIQLNKGYYNYPDYEPMHFWGSTKKLQQALNEEPIKP